ncbi:MAG: Tetratricopeptide 2 repeat protein [Gemmatimonadetes bacterium]|nr:Tetratricopeptide 2 repeat protein [Gemmatimonadota bacterium]
MGASGAGSGERQLRAVGLCLVVSLTLLALAGTLFAPFMYDDTELIRDNAWLRGWGALLRVWGQPYWPTTGPDVLGLYRPLHVAALAAIWNLGAGSPFAFHVYALALAITTSLAVWWLLERGVARGLALVPALVFATHPLHVEVIASVANGSEMLVVLGTIALVWLLRRPPRVEPATAWRRALAVGIVAAMTLLSKESGLLSLPLALVTVWGWRRDGDAPMPLRVLVLRERRAIGVAAIMLALALLARTVVLDAPVSRTSIAAQGLPIDWPGRLAAMLSLWPRVAGLLVWPTSLAPYYGPASFPRQTIAYAGAALLASVVLVALALRQARRGDRRPLVALAWVAFTYFPASNLLVPTGQILSDRVLFGATVGMALGFAWLVDCAAMQSRYRRAAAVVLLLLLTTRYVTESGAYARVWSSHRGLWTHLVSTAPEEHLGYKLLGMEARARGEQARAAGLLSRAHRMAPADRQVRFELGQALFATGRYGDAAATLAPLMRDGDANAERALVTLYLEAVGRARGADAVIRAAEPLLGTASTATAALFAGLAHERLGNPDAAARAYDVGLAASPRDSALLARRAALPTGR